jgi:hypothetical protein
VLYISEAVSARRTVITPPFLRDAEGSIAISLIGPAFRQTWRP